MKKKVLFIAMGISVVVFATTAFANIGNTAGYSTYKAALINTATQQPNYTYTLDMQIAVDGGIVQNSHEEQKSDGLGGTNSYSTSTNRSGDTYENWYISDQTATANKYTNKYSNNSNGEGEWHINTRYGSLNPSNIPNQSMLGFTATQAKLVELVVDTFSGDAKNYVVTDGNKISLNLSENQIPEIAQLYISAITEVENSRVNGAGSTTTVFYENGEERRVVTYDEPTNNNPISKLCQEVVITNFSLEGTIENNLVTNTVVKATVTGKDFEGQSHEMNASFSINFKDFGTTVPVKVNEITPDTGK